MWARVFVAIDDQLGIVGFYSWSSFTLAVADLAPEQAKRLPRYDVIPAALIGRLARDERVRGEGVGDVLLADAVRRVIGTARSLAVFAIVVEARMKRQPPSIATLDSRHSRAARSDYSCLRLKRRRLFPARCLDNRRSLTRSDGLGSRASNSSGSVPLGSFTPASNCLTVTIPIPARSASSNLQIGSLAQAAVAATR
jgi:hypothetical protein